MVAPHKLSPAYYAFPDVTTLPISLRILERIATKEIGLPLSKCFWHLISHCRFIAGTANPTGPNSRHSQYTAYQDPSVHAPLNHQVFVFVDNNNSINVGQINTNTTLKETNGGRDKWLAPVLIGLQATTVAPKQIGPFKQRRTLRTLVWGDGSGSKRQDRIRDLPAPPGTKFP